MRKPSKDVIAGLDFAGLPTPPAILIELIDTCNSSGASLGRLAEIIQQDAGVSSKVISAANSPVYRQWNEIKDINRLLVVLGLKTVKTIAITSAVQQFFSQVASPIHRCLDEIWYYSISCAYIAKSLAKLTAYEKPDEAYIAGLLHRLGQLALLQNFPEEYSDIFKRKLNGEALAEAERVKLNISSCEVGAQLIDSWKIRSFISDAVLYQHQPTEAVLDGSHLVKLINLASRLCTLEGKPDDRVLERADLLFGLNQSLIEGLLHEAQEKVQAAAGSFGIQLPLDKGTSAADKKQSDSLRQALADRVKGLALIGSGGNASLPDTDSQETLKLIQRDIGLLFGIQSSCFLLHDPTSQQLQAVSHTDEHASLLDGISISTQAERSLAARAFLSQAFSNSVEIPDPEHLSVADQQLSRILEKQELLYLPLVTKERCLGLLAAGFDTAEWDSLKVQTDLLKLFAHEAAASMSSVEAKQALQKLRMEEEHSVLQLEARKVVHEANNPLGIINNYLHILGMKLGEEHPVQDELKIIKEEIERVGKIILRIRDIPDELEQNSTSVNINTLIGDLYKLFQASLFTTHNIQASLDLDPKVPAIICQRSQMKQILTNLVKNAVEAMEGEGKLLITSHDKIHFNGKTYLEVLIQDSGPGIPDEIMRNIFSPVVSTKNSNHAGLGLAIVKNLMDQISGSISCTSSAETGTRFQLFIPRITPDESTTGLKK